MGTHTSGIDTFSMRHIFYPTGDICIGIQSLLKASERYSYGFLIFLLANICIYRKNSYIFPL